MKISVLISFLFICINLFAQDVNKVDAKGRKQGQWEKIYPGTKVYQYRGQFKDDKPIGKFSYFYKSGKVKAVINHDENSVRSVGYFYYETGQLLSYGIYRNMQKDSVWLNFTEHGHLSNTETYLNDSLNGKKTVYYLPEQVEDKTKKISAVYNYKNGKLDGEFTEYFNFGAVKSTGVYTNNIKSGIWRSYHPNGKLMLVTRYKNGVMHGYRVGFDESGKEIGRVYFYYGRKLEGDELKEKLEQMKKLGIDPNE